MQNVFPVYCIIDIYSKKCNIGYDCDLLVISNFNIGFGLIITCKWDVCFVKICVK